MKQTSYAIQLKNAQGKLESTLKNQASTIKELLKSKGFNLINESMYNLGFSYHDSLSFNNQEQELLIDIINWDERVYEKRFNEFNPTRIMKLLEEL